MGSIISEQLIDEAYHDNFDINWLVNGRPAEWAFEKYPDSPFVLNFHKKEKEFVDYFYNLFKGEIFVDNSSLELGEKIYNHKKLIYKKQNRLH